MEFYAFEKPRSMVAQIHKAMSDAISKGVLKPGQPIKESDLQSWFNTSRAPIREAIRLLEADGMVIVDHYKRKYVRPITKQILSELILHSFAEHKKIIQAFENRDCAKAEEEVRKHIISSLGHALESPVFESDSKILELPEKDI